jgi:hypothetical protein
MAQHLPDDLWRDLPRTALEFERRFATEGDCRAYWIDQVSDIALRHPRHSGWPAQRNHGTGVDPLAAENRHGG